MEMDWGTAIVGLISVLICIGPFVIMYFKRIRKENKMLQSLTEIARQQNCKISKHEYCGDFFIGADESSNFVFFFKQKKEEAISQFVDLSEIQTCKIVKKTRNVKVGMEDLSIIERVELVFIPKNPNQGEEMFELYDSEKNGQLSGELQCVDKWAKEISDQLANK